MAIMAAIMRNLIKLNGTSMGLASNILLRNNFQNFYRFLYSESSLGLVGYKNARMHCCKQYLNMENTFRTKMKEMCETKSDMILTNDLKTMLYLAQKKPEDIDLLFKMITKFNYQNKELRFGSFVFGPVVMRTLYYLDEPERALMAFKDPQFKNFFDQMYSYQILLCLLYKHEKYADMREVYDIIKTKYVSGNIYFRNSCILVMAACYKENTPETFEYALNLWKELNNNQVLITRRASIFLAALAINQNVPYIAIEMVSMIREARYIDIRCLKVAAYTALKRFTEIVPLFRSSLHNNRPNAQKETYFKDVIDDLEVAMANEKISDDFKLYTFLALLKKNDYVLPETLQNHICKEITIDPLKHKRMNPTFQSNVKRQPKSEHSSLY